MGDIFSKANFIHYRLKSGEYFPLRRKKWRIVSLTSQKVAKFTSYKAKSGELPFFQSYK
jgi:Lhr-like helicase